MKYDYLIGADPELFLVDKNGNPRSAHNMIPGTKAEPCGVMSGAIQVDGVAAEFNINPAKTAREFSENIRDVLGELKDRIESKKKGYSLLVQPTVTFDKPYFRKLPKSAKALGCMPDFSVYTKEANPSPETKEPFRTGAGHIHLGWSKGESETDATHLYDCHQATKQLDSVLYFSSLLWDDDAKRRELYGKIGAYRPKHYGVEYRPLSNAWVADPDLHIWVFEATTRAMELLDVDGVEIQKDYFAKGMVQEALKGKTQSRLELLEYTDYLVSEYGIPKLPDAYTRVIN